MAGRRERRGCEWKNDSGMDPVHRARSFDIFSALMDRGADPVILSDKQASPLIHQVYFGRVDLVAHLLQDPRVRATVNIQDRHGSTALHWACVDLDEKQTTTIVHLLLQAGTRPALTNKRGSTPLSLLRRRHPDYHTTIALFEQAPDAEKASLIVKARRLIIATSSFPAAPSYLEARLARGQPLPHVTLVPVGRNKRAKKRRKFSAMLAFFLGMRGGPKNEGMPRDVFRVVLEFLMPSWDPLRRGTGMGVTMEA